MAWSRESARHRDLQQGRQPPEIDFAKVQAGLQFTELNTIGFKGQWQPPLSLKGLAVEPFQNGKATGFGPVGIEIPAIQKGVGRMD